MAERGCLAEVPVSFFILFLKIPVRLYGSPSADFSGCWNMVGQHKNDGFMGMHDEGVGLL